MVGKIVSAVVVILIAALAFGAFTYYYYWSFPVPREVVSPSLEGITVQDVPGQGQRAVPEVGGAVVVFDRAHDNAYAMSEITSLVDGLREARASFENVDDPGALSLALKYADSLVIISPTTPYTGDEVSLVRGFLDKGGRVALFADPTRRSEIGSIASQLGVVFTPDYLYDTGDNAGNYRHIYVDDIRGSLVTSGLGRVTFFTASSLVSDRGVAFSSTTSSSSLRGEGPHAVIALLNGSILAVGDQTFMEQPNDKVTDNGALIANIASFLAGAEKRHTLKDFPFFYSDVNLRLSNMSFLGDALELKGFLLDHGVESTVSKDDSDESIFIGLFNQSPAELEALQEVFVNGSIVAEGFEYDLNRTAVIYLKGRKLWIISNTEESLADLIAIIKEERLRYHLVTDDLAVMLYEPPIREAPPTNTPEHEGGANASLPA